MSSESAGIRAIYDRCAASYGYDISSSLPARLKYELVLKYIGRSDRVLDVGCANGIHMVALAEQCREITGIDINERMLSTCREKLRDSNIGNAHTLRQSADRLAFRGATFDLAYSFSTLLLVPNIKAAVGEMVRVVRPGGILILDITGRNNFSRFYWSLYYRRHGHFGLNAFSYSAITRLLKANGARILESHALGFCDQWKYIPGLHLAKPLERLFHGSGARDLDYRISNVPGVFNLANRWYIVARKEG